MGVHQMFNQLQQIHYQRDSMKVKVFLNGTLDSRCAVPVWVGLNTDFKQLPHTHEVIFALTHMAGMCPLMVLSSNRVWSSL